MCSRFKGLSDTSPHREENTTAKHRPRTGKSRTLIQKMHTKTGRIGLRFSCSGAKSTPIHLIKGPSVCPKSEGTTRQIRPRIRNPAFPPRDHRPIGAVSRLSWTRVFLPSDGGDPERNFHWGPEVRGISGLENETESRTLKLSISTLRNFPCTGKRRIKLDSICFVGECSPMR
jgi:hypothetical protein